MVDAHGPSIAVPFPVARAADGLTGGGDVAVKGEGSNILRPGGMREVDSEGGRDARRHNDTNAVKEAFLRHDVAPAWSAGFERRGGGSPTEEAVTHEWRYLSPSPSRRVPAVGAAREEHAATTKFTAAGVPGSGRTGQSRGEASGMLFNQSGWVVGDPEREGPDDGRPRDAGRSEGGRLKGLTSKLRHPLADVRARAISNLSGKLTLGLLNPADLLDPESSTSFFADVVALLAESASESDDSGSSSTGSGGSSLAGSVLCLCLLLVKDTECLARLAGQGAAVPLSRMAGKSLSSRSPSTKDGEDRRLLAAEVLERIEASPVTSVVDNPDAVPSAGTGVVSPRGSSGPGSEGREGQDPLRPNSRKDPHQDVEIHHQRRPEHVGHQVEVEDACVLYGDGSEPRWPRWTKEFVDGPLLSAPNASAETLVACLTSGWSFPHVRLVRSEESALFDFEVRFRTTSTPSGENGLLRCLRHLRDEIVEDYPPEVLIQRPGSFGRLLSLLRTPSANERVIEEALSTASRLLQGLIRSARLHRDSSFLPPVTSSSELTSPSCPEGDNTSSGLRNGSPVVDYGASGVGERCARVESVSAKAGGHIYTAGGERGVGNRCGPDGGKGATEGDEKSSTFWPYKDTGEHESWRVRQRILWEQRQAGVPHHQQQQRQQQTFGGVTPGDAAVATLLSFRYPQSAIAHKPAGAAERGSREGRQASLAAPRFGAVQGRSGAGGEGGLSVCGAMFALFLSVSPLLAYRGVNGEGSTSGDAGAAGSGRASGRERGQWGPSSRVALLAGEMLQAVIPLLLEPSLAGGRGCRRWENGNPSARVPGEENGAMSCAVDALRMQELLCSMARLVGDNAVGVGTKSGGGEGMGGGGGGGGERKAQGRETGGATPSPLETITLQLLLLLSPSELLPSSGETFSSESRRTSCKDERGWVRGSRARVTAPFLRRREHHQSVRRIFSENGCSFVVLGLEPAPALAAMTGAVEVFC